MGSLLGPFCTIFGSVLDQLRAIFEVVFAGVGGVSAGLIVFVDAVLCLMPFSGSAWGVLYKPFKGTGDGNNYATR